MKHINMFGAGWCAAFAVVLFSQSHLFGALITGAFAVLNLVIALTTQMNSQSQTPLTDAENAQKTLRIVAIEAPQYEWVLESVSKYFLELELKLREAEASRATHIANSEGLFKERDTLIRRLTELRTIANELAEDLTDMHDTCGFTSEPLIKLSTFNRENPE